MRALALRYGWDLGRPLKVFNAMVGAFEKINGRYLKGLCSSIIARLQLSIVVPNFK